MIFLPRRSLVPLLAAAAVLLAACQPDAPPRSEPPSFQPEGVLAFERLDGSRITAIAVEIAETDSAKARGLMGRRSLPDRGGMFFPYETTEERSFWMENTYLPLDIIFVGADSQIVRIAKSAKPLSREKVHSEKPAQYVVEVRAGFAERHGLDTTARIDWRRRAGRARAGGRTGE